MNFTITQEQLYLGLALLLLVLQVYQQRQVNKTKSEIKKLWDQISLFNTMVAMKLLENQKELDKLKEKNDGK